MNTLDAFGSVAVASLIAMALTELNLELVAASAAWLAGWWLLREPSHLPTVRAGVRPAYGRPRRPPRPGPTRA